MTIDERPTTPSLARVTEAACTLGLVVDGRRMDAATRTAADAVEACGGAVGQIVRSLVFAADGALRLLLVGGAHEVDSAAGEVRTGLSLGRCDARPVRDATGIAIGGGAPIGHTTPPPLFTDEALLSHEVGRCAAGRPDSVLAVAPTAPQRATGARLIAVRPA